MSAPRHFLRCISWEHAALLDRLCLESLNDSTSAEWSGVYQHDDATYGVEWEAPLTGLLGPIFDEGDPQNGIPGTGEQLLPVVAEVKDEKDVSDWQKVQPEPEGELP